MALNDVTDAMLGWEIDVPVQKIDAGSYSDGVWIQGTVTNIAIRAVVQNATAREVELFPENIRTKETIKIHSRIRLQGTDELELNNSDIVTYNGSDWRVFSVADRATIGGYYKSFAVRTK